MSHGRLSKRWIVGVLACLASSAFGASVAEHPAFPRPTIVPQPTSVRGVAQPVVSLDGTWKINHAPPPDFWRNDIDPSSWNDVQVPPPRRRNEERQGPYVYKQRIRIPEEFAGHRVILRFDGVSNAARLWVNGQHIRDHWGSYMPWTCDITDHVTAGREAWLTVEVDDRPVGLAQFTRAGGIQRGVSLLALPQDHLTRFHVETDFDDAFRDATLKAHLRMSFHRGDRARVRLELKDAEGNAVPLEPDIVEITRDAPEIIAEFSVAHPRQWDAEHPNLYTIQASVLDASGDPLLTLSRCIGFREIEVRGNRVFINGNEVKLRGQWGGDDVAEQRANNVNHTRQKWVTEEYLEDADRLGLYVLDENPVDFAKYGAESNPEYAHQWLSLTADLIERDRSHPSVIMWGLGNESFHGPNVLRAFHYARAEDANRPVIFSWANRVPVDEELPYTIYSSHYPNLNDPKLDLGDYNVAPWHSTSLIRERTPRPVMPVLQDEYCHVIINDELIERDPNVRNFWGESIYRYWEKMFVTPGALGGDVFGLGWGGDGTVEMPEYFLLRKAYSPVRIANEPLANPGRGRPLSVPIRNWFDHTNLHELSIEWSVADDSGTIRGPDIAPHAAGILQIPARSWVDGDQLALRFHLPEGRVVDEFLLAIAPPPSVLPQTRGPAPRLVEDDHAIVISGKDFRLVFDKYRGLISEGSWKGENIIIDGPFLELLGSGLAHGEWWCDKLSARIEGNEAVVDIVGNYAVIRARFQVRIDGTGLITTSYTIDYVPGEPPPATFSPWNATSVGGYSAVGVSYMLRDDVNRLSWKRRGLWSVYPEDHIGRNEGIARREPDARSRSWSRRASPPGAGSNDWRAMKENIFRATAFVEGSPAAITALSDGSAAIRLAVDAGYRALRGGVRLRVLNAWNYPDFGLSNYAREPIRVDRGYSNTVYLRLSGSAAR